MPDQKSRGPNTASATTTDPNAGQNLQVDTQGGITRFVVPGVTQSPSKSVPFAGEGRSLGGQQVTSTTQDQQRAERLKRFDRPTTVIPPAPPLPPSLEPRSSPSDQQRDVERLARLKRFDKSAPQVVAAETPVVPRAAGFDPAFKEKLNNLMQAKTGQPQKATVREKIIVPQAAGFKPEFKQELEQTLMRGKAKAKAKAKAAEQLKTYRAEQAEKFAKQQEASAAQQTGAVPHKPVVGAPAAPRTSAVRSPITTAPVRIQQPAASPVSVSTSAPKTVVTPQKPVVAAPVASQQATAKSPATAASVTEIARARPIVSETITPVKQDLPLRPQEAQRVSGEPDGSDDPNDADKDLPAPYVHLYISMIFVSVTLRQSHILNQSSSGQGMQMSSCFALDYCMNVMSVQMDVILQQQSTQDGRSVYNVVHQEETVMQQTQRMSYQSYSRSDFDFSVRQPSEDKAFAAPERSGSAKFSEQAQDVASERPVSTPKVSR